MEKERASLSDEALGDATCVDRMGFAQDDTKVVRESSQKVWILHWDGLGQRDMLVYGRWAKNSFLQVKKFCLNSSVMILRFALHFLTLLVNPPSHQKYAPRNSLGP